MARNRAGPARQLERELVRAARRRRPGHGQVRRAAGDPHVLAGRARVRADWRDTPGGRAARLGPDERIDLRGHGRFAQLDPLTVAVGWRRPGRALGLVTWASAVGAAWWLGGRGYGRLDGR